MSCIFCRLANKEIPTDIFFEDDQVMAFNDLGPVAPVHVLIIPKRHITSVADLKIEDRALLAEMIWRAKQIAEEKNIAKSGYKLIFNCGQDGGQVISHLHLHLIGGKKLKCLV